LEEKTPKLMKGLGNKSPVSKKGPKEVKDEIKVNL